MAGYTVDFGPCEGKTNVLSFSFLSVCCNVCITHTFRTLPGPIKLLCYRCAMVQNPLVSAPIATFVCTGTGNCFNLVSLLCVLKLSGMKQNHLGRNKKDQINLFRQHRVDF